MDISRLVPRFIFADRNGRALALAIQAGLTAFSKTAFTGLLTVTDPDKMPEWRLDEMAWEYNCLYDYEADVETKRRWIKNARPAYATLGTKKAIMDYLSAFFGGATLEEAADYGGDPFHFRVTLGEDFTEEDAAWARKAVDYAKNLRSRLDDIAAGSLCRLKITVEDGLVGFANAPYAGADTYCQEVNDQP